MASAASVSSSFCAFYASSSSSSSATLCLLVLILILTLTAFLYNEIV
jgi:hypothetical protein